MISNLSLLLIASYLMVYGVDTRPMLGLYAGKVLVDAYGNALQQQQQLLQQQLLQQQFGPRIPTGQGFTYQSPVLPMPRYQTAGGPQMIPASGTQQVFPLSTGQNLVVNQQPLPQVQPGQQQVYPVQQIKFVPLIAKMFANALPVQQPIVLQPTVQTQMYPQSSSNQQQQLQHVNPPLQPPQPQPQTLNQPQIPLSIPTQPELQNTPQQIPDTSRLPSQNSPQYESSPSLQESMPQQETKYSPPETPPNPKETSLYFRPQRKNSRTDLPPSPNPRDNPAVNNRFENYKPEDLARYNQDYPSEQSNLPGNMNDFPLQSGFPPPSQNNFPSNELTNTSPTNGESRNPWDDLSRMRPPQSGSPRMRPGQTQGAPAFSNMLEGLAEKDLQNSKELLNRLKQSFG